jgi:hypothetical protein
MKRSAQQTMAIVLRCSIWNWIEVYPNEFANLCRSRQRLEGGPEVLFDQCYSIAANARKNIIFWPLQMMLLVLCPDIFMNVVESEGKTTKKEAFMDSLRKSLRGSKQPEAAVVTFVDLCKAATYVDRNDDIAMWHVVPEIENDLRAKLFDPAHPFSTDGSIDQKLMTECLTALFKLNPKSTLNTLIPACLDPLAPTAFRLVLVKSCYLLASEKRLSWNPQISDMYSVLASPLRELLLKAKDPNSQLAASAAASRGGGGLFDKKFNKKAQAAAAAEETSEKREMVLNILKLYRTDPRLAVFNKNPEEQFKENRSLITAITDWLHDPDPLIRTNAAEALLELHKPEYIEQWGPPESIMKFFWPISSRVMLAVARHILNLKDREDGTHEALALLKQLLIQRNEFLRKHQDQCTVGMNTSERLGASVALEIALLILLCSAETEICSNAISCFGHLVSELYLTEEVEDAQHAQLTIVENLRIYEELAASGGLVTGRIAQQRHIRKMLRKMRRQTPGNHGAWKEAYQRWHKLMKTVARTNVESAEDLTRSKGIFHDKQSLNNGNAAPSIASTAIGDFLEDRGEWHNYTGFLCALGGCCLGETGTGITEISDYENDPFRSNEDPEAMVRQFIERMVELLVCENVVVREVVQQALGSDLSPALYGILFTRLESEVDRFQNSAGRMCSSERNTLFVEQAIVVVKLILKRIEETSESLLAVDLGKLILNFAKYLNSLDKSAISLRIKTAMCQLCEVLMSKRDYISLRQEIKFRNQLLEYIVEWTSDFANKDITQRTADDYEAQNRNEKLQRDLDQACMKAIVKLLAQLPLQPLDMHHEADVSQVKAQLFQKYFNFFLKVLNRCRMYETVESGSHVNNRGNPELQSLIRQTKDMAKDLVPLKDDTILALSNLLSANIESGLTHSLSMAYHDDPKTRTAFMQVLTNILRQGAEFEGLAEDVKNDRYEKLVNILTETDLCIARALCEVCPASDVEDVYQLLLSALETRNATAQLLQAAIEREFSRISEVSEVFRHDCMATSLMKYYARMYGSEYLRTTLQDLILELVHNPGRWTFELDPIKLPPNANIARNQANLREMAQRFLDTIIASEEKMPRQLRVICHYLSVVVSKRFPEARLTAVGGFIFLRFFCPAIVSPEAHNIVPAVSHKETRRGLLLISKILNNLSNNVVFGTKEAFMKPLNDFLAKNMENVRRFLHNVSQPVDDLMSQGSTQTAGATAPASNDGRGRAATDPTTNAVATSNTTSRLSEAELIMLHKYLYDNQERINREIVVRRPNMTSYMGNDSDPEAYFVASKRTYEKLSTVLAQLGPPPAISPRKSIEPVASRVGVSNELFNEFMKRNVHRNVDNVRSQRIFYEGGVCKVSDSDVHIFALNDIFTYMNWFS